MAPPLAPTPGLKNPSWKTPPGETSVWFPAIDAPRPMASSVDAEDRILIATKTRRSRAGELMIVVSSSPSSRKTTGGAADELRGVSVSRQ